MAAQVYTTCANQVAAQVYTTRVNHVPAQVYTTRANQVAAQVLTSMHLSWKRSRPLKTNYLTRN